MYATEHERWCSSAARAMSEFGGIDLKLCAGSSADGGIGRGIPALRLDVDCDSWRSTKAPVDRNQAKLFELVQRPPLCKAAHAFLLQRSIPYQKGLPTILPVTIEQVQSHAIGAGT
jgi:hypothetical protein